MPASERVSGLEDLDWQRRRSTDVTRVMKIPQMLLFERDKEKERFYLLPGMGGRARRRKELKFLRWSIAAGLVVSAALAVALYLISRR